MCVKNRLADLQKGLVEILLLRTGKTGQGSTAPFWKSRMMLTTRLKAIASG